MRFVKQILTLLVLIIAVGAACNSFAQPQSQKPLTNADVLKMVRAGVPESVVVSAIQGSASSFDVSPNALVKLQKAGVTKSEMDAVMAAANKASGAANSASVSAPADSPRLPSVAIASGTASQNIPIERTQLVQTKTKPTSMASLASDSTLGMAMQAGVNTATVETTSHIHSMAGNSAASQAGGIFGSFMAHRKPTQTYVWAIPNPASTNVAPVSMPNFNVDFSAVPGAGIADFEPAIVKLTPAQNSYRLVGATEGKQDAESDPAADWQVYSHFVEDQVPTNRRKLGNGKYSIAPSSPLLPGEYGVVLRPISKSKKFSGGDVARNQGDGMLFDSVWSFQVPPDAKPQ